MNIKKYISHLFGNRAKKSFCAHEEKCETDKKYTSPLFEKFALMSEDVLEISPDLFAGGDSLGEDRNDSNTDRDPGLDDGRWNR